MTIEISKITDFVKAETFELSSLQELSEFITKHDWSGSTFRNKHRSIENFEQTSMLALDVDEGLSLSDALEMFSDFAHIIATSRHHQKIKHPGESNEKPACDRFRVVLMLKEPINDALVYEATWRSYTENYDFVDPACKDVARFWWACKDIVSVQEEGQRVPIIYSTQETKSNSKKAVSDDKKVAISKDFELPKLEGCDEENVCFDEPIDKYTISVTLETLKNFGHGIANTYDDFLNLCFAFKEANLSYDDVDSIFKLSANYDYEKNKQKYENLEPREVTFRTAIQKARQLNTEFFDICKQCGDAFKDTDVEKSVVGTLYYKSELFTDYPDLDESHFRDLNNLLIFRAMKSLNSQSADIVDTMILAEIRRTFRNNENVVAGVRQRLREVKERALRNLDYPIKLLNDYREERRKAALEKRIDEAVENKRYETARSLISELNQVSQADEISLTYNHRHIYESILNYSPGYKFGFCAIDEYASIKPGALTVIGANTSVGKTTFLANTAINVLRNYSDAKVAFLTLEEGSGRINLKMLFMLAARMGFPYPLFNYELGESFISHLQRYPAYNVIMKDDDLSEHDKIMQNALLQQREYLETKRLGVFSPDSNIDELCQLMGNLHENYGVNVFFLDYVQLISPNKEFSSQYLAIKHIADKLHSFVKETDTALVTAAQFRRNSDEKDKLVESFRESADIENIANVALGLMRSKTNPEFVDAGIIKNREGARDKWVKLVFDRPKLLFRDLTETEKATLERSKTEKECNAAYDKPATKPQKKSKDAYPPPNISKLIKSKHTQYKDE